MTALPPASVAADQPGPRAAAPMPTGIPVSLACRVRTWDEFALIRPLCGCAVLRRGRSIGAGRGKAPSRGRGPRPFPGRRSVGPAHPRLRGEQFQALLQGLRLSADRVIPASAGNIGVPGDRSGADARRRRDEDARKRLSGSQAARLRMPSVTGGRFRARSRRGSREPVRDRAPCFFSGNGAPPELPSRPLSGRSSSGGGGSAASSASSCSISPSRSIRWPPSTAPSESIGSHLAASRARVVPSSRIFVARRASEDSRAESDQASSAATQAASMARMRAAAVPILAAALASILRRPSSRERGSQDRDPRTGEGLRRRRPRRLRTREVGPPRCRSPGLLLATDARRARRFGGRGLRSPAGARETDLAEAIRGGAEVRLRSPGARPPGPPGRRPARRLAPGRVRRARRPRGVRRSSGDAEFGPAREGLGPPSAVASSGPAPPARGPRRVTRARPAGGAGDRGRGTAGRRGR